MTITLPYPPSVNHYWRKFRNHMVISAEGRAYRAAVWAAVVEQGCPLYAEGALALKIKAWMPDKRRRDLDNILKALLDAMQDAGLYEDDSQVSRIEIERMGVEPPGRVEVEIEPQTGKGKP